MATFVIFNPVLTIATVDYSAFVESVSIEYSREDIDFTNAASASNKERKAGLRDGSVSITFQQSFAAGGLNITLMNQVIAGALVAVTVKPTSGAISTSNPEYQFNALPTQFTVGGQVGAKANTSVTWPISGALTIDTTP